MQKICDCDVTSQKCFANVHNILRIFTTFCEKNVISIRPSLYHSKNTLMRGKMKNYFWGVTFLACFQDTMVCSFELQSQVCKHVTGFLGFLAFILGSKVQNLMFVQIFWVENMVQTQYFNQAKS